MQLKSKECRIENINLCNASCTMCPHSAMTRVKARMPDEVFYGLVKQAKGLGAETISIFGFGEPLMDTHIAKKVRYCTEQGLETFITTNASLLDNHMSEQLIDAGLTHIRFSVHGIEKHPYEKVHKGLSWEEVMYNIHTFTRLNKACKVSVTSIYKMGAGEVEEIKTFWKTWDIDYLEIWRLHGWAGKQNYRQPIEKKAMCERPFSGPVQIQADGKVIPCCFITDAEITLGDIYQDTIENILKGDKYEWLRERHTCGDLEGLPCETCDQMFLYDDSNSPLLYSSRDIDKQINCTSSTKYKLTNGG